MQGKAFYLSLQPTHLQLFISVFAFCAARCVFKANFKTDKKNTTSRVYRCLNQKKRTNKYISQKNSWKGNLNFEERGFRLRKAERPLPSKLRFSFISNMSVEIVANAIDIKEKV